MPFEISTDFKRMIKKAVILNIIHMFPIPLHFLTIKFSIKKKQRIKHMISF